MSLSRFTVRVVWLLLCGGLVVGIGCRKDEVARVNGVVITRAELLDRLEKDYGAGVVQRLIGQMVIRQAFDKSGLHFPQQKVEEIIQRERERAGSEEAFQQLLAMQGKTEEDLRTEIELNMKLTLLAQKDLQVTEQALREYYKENEPRYKEPQRISFSEIVLPTKTQADDVRALATKPKASFADLAKQYSIAPSQTLGGRRPTLAVDEIVPAELRDVLLSMKPGQISRPVQAGNLWFILQLHEILPAKKLTFEEARERVEEDYKGEKQKIRESDLFEQLINQSTIRIVDPKYAQLQRMYASADLLRSAPGAPAPGAEPGSTPPKAGTAPSGTQEGGPASPQAVKGKAK